MAGSVAIKTYDSFWFIVIIIAFVVKILTFCDIFGEALWLNLLDYSEGSDGGRSIFPIEVFSVYPGRRSIDVRNAVVRDIVFALNEVAQGELGGSA